MTWQESTLGSNQPEEITTLKAHVTTLKDALSTFFAILETQAEAAKLLCIDVIHPQLIAINTTCDQIIDTINDIDMGPVRSITITPNTYGVTPGYNRLTGMLSLSTLKNMNYLDSALDDEGDENRPVGTGNWGAFIGVVSCYLEEIQTAKDTISSFGDFFSMNQLKNLNKKIETIYARKAGSLPDPPMPVEPNFKTMFTAELFPVLQDVLNDTKSVVEGVKDSSTKASETKDLIIAYFNEKEQEMVDIEAKFDAFLDKFALGISGTGLYWNYIEPVASGVDLIKSAVSTGFPTAWDAHDYSISFMLAGTNAIGTIGTILGV